LSGAIGPSAAADDLTALTYRRAELRNQYQAVIWTDDGWSYLERDDSAMSPDWSQWRWMADEALFGVTTLRPATVRMTIGMRSFGRARRIRVRSGSAEIAMLTVAPERAEYDVPPLQLRPGRTLITLVSLDGADHPATDDPRRLSVALFHARLIVEN
jgi:hypothetical protein